MPTRSYAADQPYYPGSDLLALGFGTTVAMWTVGYVCRFPGMSTPAWLLLALLMICLAAGGWAAGRFTDRGLLGGLQATLLAGALNVLVLGSLVIGQNLARDLLSTFLAAQYQPVERYARRLEKVNAIERRYASSPDSDEGQ